MSAGAPRDRRLTAANGRVADIALRGIVPAARYVAGRPARVTVACAELCRSPGGARERQLLFGAAVAVFEARGGWAFVQAARDGYVGWLARRALGPVGEATHLVAAPASHLYPAPDIHAREVMALSFGARVRVVDEAAGGRFARTACGRFVPAAHLRALSEPFDDPAGVALRLIGTPYLWGGNSRAGMDCSGLVQAALHACAIACPGDSDLQQGLGTALAPDAPLARGDLVFWAGHVGIMADAAALVHANAHHMAVAAEALAGAVARIAAEGGGPVTARRRPPAPGARMI